jgi:hypothetical protein
MWHKVIPRLTERSTVGNNNYILVIIYTFSGYCCIIYMQCAADEFRLNSGTVAALTMAKVGSNCSEDYVEIEGNLLF